VSSAERLLPEAIWPKRDCGVMSLRAKRSNSDEITTSRLIGSRNDPSGQIASSALPHRNDRRKNFFVMAFLRFTK